MNENRSHRLRRSWLSRACRDLLPTVLAALVVLAARSSFANHYTVPSGSMEPTVEIGDRVVVNMASYGLRLPFSSTTLLFANGPARGDVVVLESPEDGIILLKRVVATPGDEVRVANGELWIDGEHVEVDESPGGTYEHLGRAPHPVSFAHGGGPALGPVTLPPHQYLVMGDNRGFSHDGRSFGFVDEELIRGRAVGVFLRNGTPTWQAL